MLHVKHPELAARIEKLLYEQLEELGENPKDLSPHSISQHMQCEVYPDQSMIYTWKDFPVLRVVQEQTPTGIRWRMFTRDEADGIN